MGQLDDLKDEVVQLKRDKQSAEATLKERQVSGKAAMSKALLNVAKALVIDPSIQAHVSLVKRRREGRWVFEIGFDEREVANNPSASDVLVKIKSLFNELGLSSKDNPIRYE